MEILHTYHIYQDIYGIVQNSKAYICDQVAVEIYNYFVCFFFFALFYFACDMCFPKTFKRFWHDDIDNLILLAEIQIMLCLRG